MSDVWEELGNKKCKGFETGKGMMCSKNMEERWNIVGEGRAERIRKAEAGHCGSFLAMLRSLALILRVINYRIL